MCPTIHLTNEAYEGLKRIAEPFETPTGVVQRLLDTHFGNSGGDGSTVKSPTHITQAKPVLIFSPANEDEFKSLLVKKKQARVVLHKSDGSLDSLTWNAYRFNESSNLRGNLWSGYLRDWKEKGIVKAEITID